ncbi:helix-turn-helix transcriptional regulator [Shewanella sp. SR44-3]|jgi:DNA-binding transcriptional ArsR family regulator|uniref:ArsR/SmtB family transcription factor n=1 Tax=Shewanella sp. SR44-3 TaxID=2760936 RepID=UPI0015FDFA54|nr:helix-turn-helix domain-containing protein [Shewanella sp. SR44-3]MBB1268050.1 helix-turn-helix transcriptional regulator [Shewanella sp. SR44-3]
MNIEIVAKALKELGHPTRLAVYKQVMKAGPSGVAVGKLGENIGIPNSTLSHHISSMVSANLISQHREGRVLHCIANYEMRENVLNFLQDECCVDSQF